MGVLPAEGAPLTSNGNLDDDDEAEDAPQIKTANIPINVAASIMVVLDVRRVL